MSTVGENPSWNPNQWNQDNDPNSGTTSGAQGAGDTLNPSQKKGLDQYMELLQVYLGAKEIHSSNASNAALKQGQALYYGLHPFGFSGPSDVPPNKAIEALQQHDQASYALAQAGSGNLSILNDQVTANPLFKNAANSLEAIRDKIDSGQLSPSEALGQLDKIAGEVEFPSTLLGQTMESSALNEAATKTTSAIEEANGTAAGTIKTGADASETINSLQSYFKENPTSNTHLQSLIDNLPQIPPDSNSPQPQ